MFTHRTTKRTDLVSSRRAPHTVVASFASVRAALKHTHHASSPASPLIHVLPSALSDPPTPPQLPILNNPDTFA